jgi:chromosome segregation ATPase
MSGSCDGCQKLETELAALRKEMQEMRLCIQGIQQQQSQYKSDGSTTEEVSKKMEHRLSQVEKEVENIIPGYKKKAAGDWSYSDKKQYEKDTQDADPGW